ncbi:hypothetical protein Tco_0272106 [Tanacetum coccineum]
MTTLKFADTHNIVALFGYTAVSEGFEADKDVNEEMDDSLVRAATTASSLEAEQDSGSGPRCQETIGDTIALTRYENLSKHSNDPLLARGNTHRSGEDRLKLEELMELYTTLQSRVLALETTKTTQATEISSSKRRVKKLERRNKSRTHRLKRLYRELKSAKPKANKDCDTRTKQGFRDTYTNSFFTQPSQDRTKLVEESSKKAEAEIAHESSLKRAGEELE